MLIKLTIMSLHKCFVDELRTSMNLRILGVNRHSHFRLLDLLFWTSDQRRCGLLATGSQLTQDFRSLKPECETDFIFRVQHD